jgi:hypothetical protein
VLLTVSQQGVPAAGPDGHRLTPDRLSTLHGVTGLETILLAVLPAGITAALGYAGVRSQRDTSLAETKAATLRVRIEHADAERAKRQAAYQEYLVLLTQHAAVMQRAGSADEAWVDEWFEKYWRQESGLRIFAPPGVQDALGRLAAALDVVADEANQGDQSGPGLPRLRSAFLSHRDQVIAAIEAVAVEMRKDVALPTLDDADDPKQIKPGSPS